jgi:3-hydroxyisobutyrate dehydrogenase
VRTHGLRYVDRPVAGRPDAAAAGKLAIFVGAEPSDLEAIRPLILPLSKEIFHFGPPGTGTAFKLIYNVQGVVQIVGLAEALSAAEAAGIDLETAARAFAHGNTGSGHVIKHGPFMATGKHEDPPGFTAAGRIKDLTYGIGLEERLGEDPVVGRAALAVYRHMVELGLKDAADSKVIDTVRRRRRG